MRRGKRRNMDSQGLVQLPYRQLRHTSAPTCVMSEDEVEMIHLASMEILESVGLNVMDRGARDIFRAAGFDVDEANERVRFDRDGVLELVGKAPSMVSVRGRDAAKRVRMGDGYMAIAAVGGPPFVSDLEKGRRAGNAADMENFIKLTHMINILHLEGGMSVEPTDLPPETRHLDFYRACATLTDKPWKPITNSAMRAEDALAVARITYGETDEQLAADPVFFVNTNTNTPLALDGGISMAIEVYAQAGQVVCVTPFALSGAMAPVTIAGALALQNAETLAACAFVQAIRPGCPYIYGSFTSNVDMKTGSPAFGTPEYTLGAQASGQMARRYNLPWRSSNVNASNAPDVQAAYESQMSLWGAFTGHVGVLNQGAGWLEGGLVASYEKLIIDAEMLQAMSVWQDGLIVDAASIGLEAVREVGPGGHFFGTQHTLDRYETAFYQPFLSDWSNFENWSDKGAKTATERAHAIWKTLLQDYEQPSLAKDKSEELNAFVARRKQEIVGSA